MECDTCGLIFMRMSDLRRHAAREEHREQTSYIFSCLPCSLHLHTIPDVIEHVESAEHSIMSLAADNPFDTLAKNPGNHNESFPPLYFCMLCSCRDGEPYGVHLKSAIHKNIARLMRAIFCNKTIHYTNDARDEHLLEKIRNPNGPLYCELCNRWSSNWYNYKRHLSSIIHVKTQEFMNKLINVNRYPRSAHTCDDFCYSFSFACGLCNIHFNSHESYEYHLENKTHKRVDRFLSIISNMVRNMDVVIRAFGPESSETFCNSLPSLYYCDLCERFFLESSGYVQHSKSFVHKRIEELFKKLSDKRKGEVIRLCLIERDSAKISTHYCKLCMVGFSAASDYDLHLNDKEHSKIEHFISSLTVESDANFINSYIDAQIQMMCGDSNPPNYCDLCNILHFESEKYEQHLATDEHKQAEKLQLKNSNFINKNASKQLRKSSFSKNQELVTDQDNTVVNKSNSLAGVLHQDTEPLINKTELGSQTRKTSIGNPPCPGFVTHALHSYPTLFRPDVSVTNYATFSGNHCGAPYITCPALPFFQAPEPYGYYPLPNFLHNNNYPPWPGFETGVTNNHHPPWTGFQAPAYATYSNNPPWPGFHPYANATNIRNPPWSGFATHIQPPKLEFKNSESNSICPPGTEDEENNSNFPFQQIFEDGSAQIGLETSDEATSNFSADEHCCELCNYTCSNSRLYEKHLKSEKHKKLRKLINKKCKKVCLKMPTTSETAGHPLQYNCELCDVFNPNVAQYEKHLATSKHKRNQWLLYVLVQKPL